MGQRELCATYSIGDPPSADDSSKNLDCTCRTHSPKSSAKTIGMAAMVRLFTFHK